MTTDQDKILNFDFHYAVCLLALEDLAEALSDLYVSVWLMTSGNDIETNKFYASTYANLIDFLFEQVGELEITDELRTQYEQEQSNGSED